MLNFHKRPIQIDSPPNSSPPLTLATDIGEDGFPSHESVLKQIAVNERVKEQTFLKAHTSQPDARPLIADKSIKLGIAEDVNIHSHDGEHVSRASITEAVDTLESSSKSRGHIEGQPRTRLDHGDLTREERIEEARLASSLVPILVSDAQSEIGSAPDPPLLLPEPMQQQSYNLNFAVSILTTQDNI
jgi:hypothetical protein